MEILKSFDPGRAMLEDYLDGSLYPPRLIVKEPSSLQHAVATGQLALDSRLLVFEYEQTLYTFPMTVVLSYNVIQGQIGDQPWMMTFCNACNTGMVFNPVVDGKMLHFQRRGSYDGLLLIWDEETNSYWQHVTGQCLYGASAGQQLGSITTTRQMTVGEVLARTNASVLLSSALSPEQEKLSRMMEKMRANPDRVESGIISTIREEDTRRPRFELGLGVWNLTDSIFFPLPVLYAHDRVLITKFGDRPLLIYQQLDSVSPAAAYIETGRAVWVGEALRLDKGAYIQNDTLFGAGEQPQPLQRPTQLLMRWYGFALTFPGCRLPGF
jgi:Protein of unknown function (DUF3179)